MGVSLLYNLVLRTDLGKVCPRCLDGKKCNHSVITTWLNTLETILGSRTKETRTCSLNEAFLE